MLNRLNFLLTTVFITIVILWWNGYQFGHNDQVETLPYILYLHDNTLFQQDVFIKSLTQAEPNERSAFVYMLLPFAQYLETAVIVFHLLFLLLLVAALQKIAQQFISNRIIVVLVVIATLTVFYLITLGEVDLYYNTFQGGNIALAMVSWAIYFFIKKKYFQSILLLVVATPFQILVGLNTFLLLAAVLLFQWFRKKEETKTLLMFGFVYAMTAGVYFLIVIMKKENSYCELSNKALFDLVFDFRNAHHFLIAAFPIKRSVAFLILVLMALFAAPKIFRTLPVLLIIAGALVGGYAIVTESTHFVPAAAFQLYILTAWMKFFALVLIAAQATKCIPTAHVTPTKTTALLLLLCMASFSLLVNYQRPTVAYEWGTAYKTQNKEIDICIKAKEHTAKSAVFIHPFEFSALKFFGQRSAYTEFKAALHQRCGIPIWYQRIQEVYGIHTGITEKGFALKEKANQYLESYSEDKWQQLKAKGVTHAILPKSAKPSIHQVREITSNSQYVIIEL